MFVMVGVVVRVQLLLLLLLLLLCYCGTNAPILPACLPACLPAYLPACLCAKGGQGKAAVAMSRVAGSMCNTFF